MIIITILLLAFALDRMFRLRQSNVILKHRFKLYALRDALRESAVRGDIKSSNWVFQYLDSSIAKSIDVLPRVSIWRAAVMTVFKRKDAKHAILVDHLWRELAKPENTQLKKVFLHYVAETGYFIACRHDTVYFFVSTLFRMIKCSKWLNSKYKVIKYAVTTAPETSTLYQYA